MIGVIAVGGAAGSLARWALTAAFPTAQGGFAWSTFGVNLAGCLLIGLLMGLIAASARAERGLAHPLAHPFARPFLGVGFLGGFTTFSTYAVDVQQTVASGHSGLAMAYLAATPAGAVVAAGAGLWAGRAAVAARSRDRRAIAAAAETGHNR